MQRIMVNLEADESKALGQLAFRERRDPRAQAALLIRRELEQCGLLLSTEPVRPAAQQGQPGGGDGR